MRRGVSSRDLHPGTRRIAVSVGFVVILVAGLVGVVGPAGARPGAGGPRIVNVVTNHARITADAFDGEGTSADSDAEEDTDFSAFSPEPVLAQDLPFDPTEDRTAEASASQDTTVDDTGENLKVESTGTVDATWGDLNPGDGRDPEAHGTSEFTFTFEVTDVPEFFSVSGVLTATADASIECTTVTVTSPDGTTFDVAAPSDCGAPGDLSVLDTGTLQPGTYTFSVVANAQAFNPDATGGSAEAFFDVGLDIGCTITGTAEANFLEGTGEDDIICGLGGDDTIEARGGDDVIFGGSGADRIIGEGGDDVIAGQGGPDSPTVEDGSPGLFGGAGNDQIDGGEGPDKIVGGTGNDILAGAGGLDEIYGDDIQGCDGALSDPGLDDDLIIGGGDKDVIFGCQGLDKIFGEGGDDEIDGNTGNDVIRGEAGSDKIHGNDGSDTLTGGTRKDVLLGDGDNDTLLANDGVLDVVRGGPGSGDEAKIDDGIDTVTGVEVFL